MPCLLAERVCSSFLAAGVERIEIQKLADSDDWSPLRSYLTNLDKTLVETRCLKQRYFSEKSGLFESWRELQIQQYFGSFLSWQKARLALAQHSKARLEPGDSRLAAEIRKKLVPEFIHEGANLQKIRNPRNCSDWLVDTCFNRFSRKRPLEGKSVTVVGPGPVSQEVLRDWHQGGGHILVAPKMMLERRELIEGLPQGFARIGYYNGGTCINRKSEIIEALNSGVLIRVKNRSSRNILIKGSSSVLKPQIGVAADPRRRIFGDYGPQLIAVILFDLLRNGADRIRVAGVDFYAGGPHTSYANDYQAPALRGHDLLRGLRRHDVFSTRAFVQNLWRRGLVTGDDAFERVMSTEHLDFARELDEAFK